MRWLIIGYCSFPTPAFEFPLVLVASQIGSHEIPGRAVEILIFVRDRERV